MYKYCEPISSIFTNEALPQGPLTVTFTDSIVLTRGVISTTNSAVQLYCMSDNKKHVADWLLLLLLLPLW